MSNEGAKWDEANLGEIEAKTQYYWLEETSSSQLNKNISSEDHTTGFSVSELLSGAFFRVDPEQIHPDDYEAMALRSEMTMLFFRAERFFKRTGRNVFQNNPSMKSWFDGSRACCFHCNDLGYFSQEGTANAGRNDPFPEVFIPPF